MAVLRWGTRVALLLLLLSGAGIWWMLGTQTGTTWLLGALSERAGPDIRLQIGKVNGRLLDSLTLESLVVEIPGLTVRLNRLRLDWQPWALLQRELWIEDLVLDAVQVETSDTGDTGEASGQPMPTDLRLPLAIRLDRLSVTDLDYSDGKAAQRIDTFSVSLKTHQDQLIVSDLSISVAPARLALQASVDLQAPFAFVAEVKAAAAIPELGPIDLTSQFKGDIQAVHIKGAVQKPFLAHFTGDVGYAQALEFDLSGDWQQLRWPLTGPADIRSTQGNYQIQGRLDDYHLTLAGDLQLPDTPPMQIALNGKGDMQQFTLSHLSATSELAKMTLQANMALQTPFAFAGEINVAGASPELGQIDLSSQFKGDIQGVHIDGALQEPFLAHVTGDIAYAQALEFDLSGDWQQLRWPLTGPADIRSTQGRYQIQGRADDYRLALASDLQLPDAPPLQIDLSGKGDQAGVRLVDGDITTLNGRLRPRGEVSWSPDVNWRIDLAIIDLDPGAHWADWSGKLSGAAKVKGGITPAGTVISFSLQELKGDLRGYPVKAKGSANLQGAELDIPMVDLSLGDNHLSIQGRIGTRMQLDWALSASDLAQVIPTGQGTITGKGSVRGTTDKPQLQAELEGQRLGYADQSLERLSVNLSWSDQAVALASQLSMLRIGSQQLDGIQLEMTGTPEDHTLSAQLSRGEDKLTLQTSGGWRDSAYSGLIQSISVAESILGQWQLQQPTAFDYRADEVTLGQACLIQQRSALCTQGKWRSQGDVAADVSLQRFPLSRLAGLLSPQMQIEGDLDGTLKLSGSLDKPVLKARLASSTGTVQIPVDQPEEVPWVVSYEQFLTQLDWQNDALLASLSMDLASAGHARAELRLDAADDQQQRAIAGKAAVQFPNLKLLEGFFPQLYGLSGKLDLTAALAGTLEKPAIELDAAIADASAGLPELGINLQQVQLKASSQDGQTMLLNGQAESGGGKVELKGKLQWGEAFKPVWQLQLQGKDFQVAKLPEADVWVSPDLQLGDDGTGIRIGGSLQLPKAIISLGEIRGGGLQPSSDEIILTQESDDRQAQQRKTALVSAKIKLQLGDEVRFEGYGLQTRMTGGLDLRYADNQPLGFGALEMKEGRYKALGQDLTIDKGRILFSGPLDNPGLDLAAYRQSSDGQVKAWLNVSGNVRKPNLKVSSEPALPDDEAMSYLLTGRGLDTPGQAMNTQMLINNLGLAGGGSLLKSIRAQSMLDQLEFKTGDTAEDSALLLGKQLNPNLYVGYTMGLFDETGFAQLRLKLSRKLEVETLSGTKQSVDLYYTLEHD